MITLIFIFYLLIISKIAVIAYRRTQDLSDYVLGGRNLGPATSGLSAGASDMSGWLLMGLPAYTITAGVSSFWLLGGLLVGAWLNWLFVAKRLRVYSQQADNALTIPAFFEKRFEDKTHHLRIICAFFVLTFFLFYTSSGLVASGKLFENIFGINYTLAVCVGAIAIISYTLFGGFLAVSWTDVLQGLLMLAALIIVPLFAIGEIGGTQATLLAIEEKNPELLNIMTNAQGEAITLIGTLSLLGWGLGYFGQPHILARFKGIKNKELIPTARRISILWSGTAMIGACLVGFSAIGFLDENLADNETAFIIMVDALFHPAIAGILLAAILAAIMSTADSQLLISSSALAEDFYKTLFNKEATQKQLVKISRIAVIIIAVIATFFALDRDSKVLSLVSYAWAGFGAAFGPTLIMSLYWKNMTKTGALAGIIVGGLTVVVWKQLSGGWFELYEIIPGIVFSFIAIIGVSIVTPKPSNSIIKRYEEVKVELGS